ncbi:hypothetical protein R3W88_025013 [Solanum pinnatisectum]|uniref:Uncharacterized protein n=1 Tax=Solanum pinnatisectum TaxID=50273 RepID=A0AAV9M1S1_9SOLN|nr:hypothetical protein R3W88_025013 [Solanum pinnatisectum]
MPQENHENEGTSGGQSSRPFKMPRMVGFGVLVGDDSFTTVNSRVVDIGTRVPRRSDEGKSVIMSNKLQQMMGEKRIQTRSAAVAIDESQSNSTTKK